jgi:hypothetical protein
MLIASILPVRAGAEVSNISASYKKSIAYRKVLDAEAMKC